LAGREGLPRASANAGQQGRVGRPDRREAEEPARSQGKGEGTARQRAEGPEGSPDAAPGSGAGHVRDAGLTAATGRRAEYPVDCVIASMRAGGRLDEAGAAGAQSLLAEGKPLEEAIVGADGLGEEAVLRFLAEAFEIPYVDAERLEKNPP